MNDNNDNEAGLLLEQAKEMIAKDKIAPPLKCSLHEGGACPLLAGMMMTLKDVLRK